MISMARRLMMKLRAALSSRQQDDDFDAELANHLDLAAADAIRRGVPPERALREAKLRLGSLQLTRELHRDERGLPLLRDLGQDVRYALRSMRRAPGFSAVVTLTLALGIGANTAVFSMLNAAMLRQLAVPFPHELVHVTAAPVLSLPMYEDIRARQQVFVDLAASTPEWPVRLTIPPSPLGLQGTGARGDRRLDNFPTHFVSANYFAVLALRPQLGRFFTDVEDSTPQSSETEGSVAVIGDRLWEREFGRDPAALGRVVYVNRSACRIVGVAPRGFTGDRVGLPVELWVPLRPFSPIQYVNARGGQFTQTIGRLKPGVSITQAQAAMTLLHRDLRKAEWDAFPETRRHNSIETSAIEVRTAATGLDSANGLRARFTTPLWIVMAMVVAVLLIACANVANLLLARSASRSDELQLRVALGCSRQRMIRQLLTESVLLAGLGAAVGVVFAYAGVQAMIGLADAGSLEVRPDRNVLAFVTVVTILAGIAFGLAPALGGSRLEVRRPHVMQSASGRVTRRRLSPLLVFTQVSLSLAILIGAGLLVRSLQNLSSIDVGFKPGRVVLFSLYHDPM